MISDRLYRRFYSDPRYNGTSVFYAWLRQGLRPGHRVLNFGAGPETRNPTRILKGEVAEAVGADIDPVVLENTELDRGFLIRDGRIPIEDGYFDVAFSDFVLEHVERPQEFLAEIHRLLKPGGKYYFRTPNRYHYVTAISALTPHAFHQRVANPSRGMAQDAHEPWPTFYRMNSRAQLTRLAREAGFADTELRMIEPDPSYLRFHAVPFLMGVAYERMVNATELLKDLRINILGCLTKPGGQTV